MKVDFYTKAVLTVIACALVGIVVQNSVGQATAQNGVQRVVICNYKGERCANVGIKSSVRNMEGWFRVAERGHAAG